MDNFSTAWTLADMSAKENPTACTISDNYRHWSPSSQEYASVEVLQQYVRAGWKLDSSVATEEFSCFGANVVRVYYFRLTLGNKNLWIPIIENPAAQSLVRDHNLNTHSAAPNCKRKIANDNGHTCNSSPVTSEPSKARQTATACACSGISTRICCCAARLQSE